MKRILALAFVLLVISGLALAAWKSRPAVAPLNAPAAIGGMQPGELRCPIVAQIGEHRYTLVPNEPLHFLHLDPIDVPDGFGGILLTYWWLHSENTDGVQYSYVFDHINALARIRELKLEGQ